jgi:hypothetical protein
MAAINVTIKGTMVGADGGSVPVTVVGDLTITGLSPGGGPIIPAPPSPPTAKPPTPSFPIVLPPGTPPFNPGAPGGYPPMIGGGPIAPPPGDPAKPPMWIPVWLPDVGWIAVPAFPHPTPSKK